MASATTMPPTTGRSRADARGAAGAHWLVQAFSGLLLLGLLGLHMVAHHFVVDEVGGLRSYQQVLEYIGNPLIFTIECFFLVIVTAHALMGLRSVLFDMGFGTRARYRIDAGLWVLGVATVAYGFFLVGTLASRA